MRPPWAREPEREPCARRRGDGLAGLGPRAWARPGARGRAGRRVRERGGRRRRPRPIHPGRAGAVGSADAGRAGGRRRRRRRARGDARRPGRRPTRRVRRAGVPDRLEPEGRLAAGPLGARGLARGASDALAPRARHRGVAPSLGRGVRASRPRSPNAPPGPAPGWCRASPSAWTPPRTPARWRRRAPGRRSRRSRSSPPASTVRRPRAHRDLARARARRRRGVGRGGRDRRGAPTGGFPVRNRWIAGLVGRGRRRRGRRDVRRAAHRRRGARAGARGARRAGPPWDAHAAGSLALLGDGAAPLIDADDGWRALAGAGSLPAATLPSIDAAAAPSPWDALLGDAPRDVAELAEASGLALGAALASLEAGVVAGWAQRGGTSGYRLARRRGWDRARPSA